MLCGPTRQGLPITSGFASAAAALGQVFADRLMAIGTFQIQGAGAAAADGSGGKVHPQSMSR